MRDQASRRGWLDRTWLAVKAFGQRHAPFLHPWWMFVKRTVFRRRFRTTQERFTEIFRANHWRNVESASGFGSSLEATVQTREALIELVDRYAITSLLDVPCGDFHWMQTVDFGGDYCGADIVPELVAQNQQRFGDDRRRFIVLDVTRDPLPRSDLILCRDCLNHLSLEEAVRALQNIAGSGSPHVALTHHPTTMVNRPQSSGFDYRPLNLMLPPFNWPEPIDVWAEAEPGKTLALWGLQRDAGPQSH
jgi:hypothetical protein